MKNAISVENQVGKDLKEAAGFECLEAGQQFNQDAHTVADLTVQICPETNTHVSSKLLTFSMKPASISQTILIVR